MRKIVFITLLLVLAMPLFAQSSMTDAAQMSAESWLALIDKHDYAATYDEASSMFKAAVTKEDWVRKVKPVRDPLGNVLSRKIQSAEYTKTLPGAPDGQYVVLKFDTSYQNKKSAVETVVMTLDKDGQWRVSGYFIR